MITAKELDEMIKNKPDNVVFVTDEDLTSDSKACKKCSNPMVLLPEELSREPDSKFCLVCLIERMDKINDSLMIAVDGLRHIEKHIGITLGEGNGSLSVTYVIAAKALKDINDILDDEEDKEGTK